MDSLARLTPFLGNAMLAKDDEKIFVNEKRLLATELETRNIMEEEFNSTWNSIKAIAEEELNMKIEDVRMEEDAHRFAAAKARINGVLAAAQGRLSPGLLPEKKLQEVRAAAEKRAKQQGRLLLWRRGWNAYNLRVNLGENSTHFTVYINIPTTSKLLNKSRQSSTFFWVHQHLAQFHQKELGLDLQTKQAYIIPDNCKQIEDGDRWCEEEKLEKEGCSTALLQKDESQVENKCRLELKRKTRSYAQYSNGEVNIFCHITKNITVTCGKKKEEKKCEGLMSIKQEGCKVEGDGLRAEVKKKKRLTVSMKLPEVEGGEEQQIVHLLATHKVTISPRDLSSLRKNGFCRETLRATTAGEELETAARAVESVTDYFESSWTAWKQRLEIVAVCGLTAAGIVFVSNCKKVWKRRSEKEAWREAYQKSLEA